MLQLSTMGKNKTGYKYTLSQQYIYETLSKKRMFPQMKTKYINVYHAGGVQRVVLARGYSWDGATLAPDDNFLEPSLVHDALYQLMNLGELPWSYRKACDKVMLKLSLKLKVSTFQAKLYYYGVRIGQPVSRLWDKIRNRLL